MSGAFASGCRRGQRSETGEHVHLVVVQGSLCRRVRVSPVHRMAVRLLASGIPPPSASTEDTDLTRRMNRQTHPSHYRRLREAGRAGMPTLGGVALEHCSLRSRQISSPAMPGLMPRRNPTRSRFSDSEPNYLSLSLHCHLTGMMPSRCCRRGRRTRLRGNDALPGGEGGGCSALQCMGHAVCVGVLAVGSLAEAGETVAMEQEETLAVSWRLCWEVEEAGLQLRGKPHPGAF